MCIKSHQYTKKRIFSPGEGNSHPFLQDENSPPYIRSPLEWTQPDLQARERSRLSSSRPAAVIIPDRPETPGWAEQPLVSPTQAHQTSLLPANAYLPALVQEMPAGFPVLSMCPVQAGDGATVWSFQQEVQKKRAERRLSEHPPPPTTKHSWLLEQHRRLNGMGSHIQIFFFTETYWKLFGGSRQFKKLRWTVM